MAMVAEAFEEEPTGKRRELEGFYVDIDTILVPSVRPNGIGDKRSEDAVKVEKEEDRYDKGDDKVDHIHPVELTVR